jgi:hypothetical protein
VHNYGHNQCLASKVMWHATSVMPHCCGIHTVCRAWQGLAKEPSLWRDLLKQVWPKQCPATSGAHPQAQFAKLARGMEAACDTHVDHPHPYGQLLPPNQHLQSTPALFCSTNPPANLLVVHPVGRSLEVPVMQGLEE